MYTQLRQFEMTLQPNIYICIYIKTLHNGVVWGQFGIQNIKVYKVTHTRALHIHTEKSFRNHVKSNRYQIVCNILRFILNQTEFHFVSNQSENGRYNLISVHLTKIRRRFLNKSYSLKMHSIYDSLAHI